MEKGNYICELCSKDYIPTRIGVQKFCSSKCRKKYNYHLKKNKNYLPTTVKNKAEIAIPENGKDDRKNKIEKMSAAGVGNAALGSLLAEAGTTLLKNAFTNEDDKPATKGDLKNLENMIASRYFEVHNISKDVYGRIPYFDMSTSKIVYYDEYQNRFEYPQYDLR